MSDLINPEDEIKAKCPKCGNTTFQVSKIPIVGHEDYEVVICGADKCGAIITSYIPMAHTFLIEMQVKLDKLLKRLPAP